MEPSGQGHQCLNFDHISQVTRQCDQKGGLEKANGGTRIESLTPGAVETPLHPRKRDL